MSSRELGDIVTISILGASATVLAVGSEQNYSENRTSPSVKSSSKGDTHMGADATITDIEATLTGLFVLTDLAQARLIVLQDAGTKVTLVKERSNVTVGSASAVITGLNFVHNHNENATFDASFDLDGNWA